MALVIIIFMTSWITICDMQVCEECVGERFAVCSFQWSWLGGSNHPNLCLPIAVSIIRWQLWKQQLWGPFCTSLTADLVMVAMRTMIIQKKRKTWHDLKQYQWYIDHCRLKVELEMIQAGDLLPLPFAPTPTEEVLPKLSKNFQSCIKELKHNAMMIVSPGLLCERGQPWLQGLALEKQEGLLFIDMFSCSKYVNSAIVHYLVVIKDVLSFIPLQGCVFWHPLPTHKHTANTEFLGQWRNNGGTLPPLEMY